MPAKKPLPREADGTVNIQNARKQMRGHRTNAEIEERAKSEIVAEGPKRIVPPKYLPESLRDEFRSIAKQLVKLHIFCALDYDMLARYLIARSAWLVAQQHANQELRMASLGDAAEWSKLAKLYFGQCQSCAAALGLSISSRCRLVLPQPPKEDEEDAMSRMLRERAAKRRKA